MNQGIDENLDLDLDVKNHDDKEEQAKKGEGHCS